MQGCFSGQSWDKVRVSWNICPRKGLAVRGFSTRPRGFEPLTFGSVDRRSIQLSYGRSCVSEHSDRAAMVALRDASGEGGIRTRDGT